MPRRRLRLRSPLLLLLPSLAAACAAPAPPPVKTAPVEASRPAPVAAPPPPHVDSPAVSVTALARVPAHFQADGDLGEWGSLLPAPPPPPKGKPKKDEPPPPPNPLDAPSHVALALRGEGAVIAAELGEASRGGIWLGLSFPAPTYPSIGHFQRGGGVQELNCEADMIGNPEPPEVVASCKELLDQHAAFLAREEARFTRFYRIDKDGIRAAGEDGSLSAIEGAIASFKPSEKGGTIEVVLPAKALPRVAEAPVTSLRLVAVAATTPRPPGKPPGEWVPLSVAEVGFAPFAALRARAFQEASTITWPPLGMSYQPGEALELEVVRYASSSDGTSVTAAKELLYEKKETLGDIEVGYVFTDGTSLGIFRKGEILDLVRLDGSPREIVKRGKDLHVMCYAHYTNTDSWTDSAFWSAVAVHPDGTYAEGLVEYSGLNPPWGEVDQFHNAGYDVFGIKGTMRGDEEGSLKALEITWRWDAKQGVYKAKSRNLPAPKRKKAPAAARD